MKELPLRLCEACQKEYQPKRFWQRFCSIPCKNNNYTSTHQLIQTTEQELPKHYILSPATIDLIATACVTKYIEWQKQQADHSARNILNPHGNF